MNARRHSRKRPEWQAALNFILVEISGRAGVLLSPCDLEAHPYRQLDLSLAIEAQRSHLTKVAVINVAIGWLELRRIEQVEELSAQLEAEAFRERKFLTDAQIDSFRPRAGKRISWRVASMDRRSVIGPHFHKRASIEPLLQVTSLRQRSRQIRPGARAVAVLASHVEREAASQCDDWIHLPAAENGVLNAVPVVPNHLSVSEGQLIQCAEHEPVANVQIGIRSFLRLPLERIDHVATVAIVAIESRRRIVDRVRPGIRTGELQTGVQPALRLHVQAVIDGVPAGIVHRNRA